MTQRLSRLGRVAVAAAATIAMAGTALVATNAAQAATLCESDCIGAVTVTSGPDAARITFTTKANTHVKVQVSGVGGAAPVKTYGHQDGSTWATEYDIVATGLPTQGAAYRYIVTATDYLGASWQKVGHFSTKVREVSVDFGTLKITDDSDNSGAGEIIGGVQIAVGSDSCSGIKRLDPLSLTTTTSLATGATRTVGPDANLWCSKVPATIAVESVLVDDDEDTDEGCPTLYVWGYGTFFGQQGSTPCRDWNYGILKVSSPLDDTTGGFGDKSFTVVADPETWNGYSTPIEWTLTGVATFSHKTVPVSLPGGSSAPVDLHLTSVAGNASAYLNWVPSTGTAMAVSGYRVQWRVPGGSWSGKDVAAGMNYASISGLTNGQKYDVRVFALDKDKLQWARDTFSVTPVAPIVVPPPVTEPPTTEPPTTEPPTTEPPTTEPPFEQDSSESFDESTVEETEDPKSDPTPDPKSDPKSDPKVDPSVGSAERSVPAEGAAEADGEVAGGPLPNTGSGGLVFQLGLALILLAAGCVLVALRNRLAVAMDRRH
jgi:hypothetical protein